LSLVHIYKLSVRQQKAIPALVTHATIKGAAAELGLNQVTLIRWLTQPAFAAAYREARHVVMAEAFAVLQKASAKAVETIISVMEDPEANAFVRLQAAQSVLNTALKTRATEELEERIAALEQAAEHPPVGRSAGGPRLLHDRVPGPPRRGQR
jgi:hypothetical protein